MQNIKIFGIIFVSSLMSAFCAQGDVQYMPGGLYGIEAEDFVQVVPGSGVPSGWKVNWTVAAVNSGNSAAHYYSSALLPTAKAVRALPDEGRIVSSGNCGQAARLDYNVTFLTTGTHYVWIRALYPSSNSDSVNIGLNGVCLTPLSGVTNQSSPSNVYVWHTYLGQQGGDRAKIEIPTAGSYMFNLWWREDGVFVDSIIIAKSEFWFPKNNTAAPIIRNILSGSTLNVPGVVLNAQPIAYLNAVVRDFVAAKKMASGSCAAACHWPNKTYTVTVSGGFNTDPRAHLDFENGGSAASNIVHNYLTSNRKPILQNPGSGSTSTRENFEQWYNDVPSKNVALEVAIPFSLVSVNGNIALYRYTNIFFFMADESPWAQQWGRGREGPDYNSCSDQNKCHNFHFTTEVHSSFVYQRGQTFRFLGDDDVWVFINRTRVVDLGGVHGPTQGSVNLDTLNLVPGESYDIDFFHAERKARGSQFEMETSILLSEPTSLDDCGQTLTLLDQNRVNVSPCRQGSLSNPKKSCSDPRVLGTTGSCNCFTGECNCVSGYSYSPQLGYCTACNAAVDCNGNGFCGIGGCVCSGSWSGTNCNCFNNGPYTLLTNTTSALKATQSAWVHLSFKGGCKPLTDFRVIVSGVPDAGFLMNDGNYSIYDYNYNNYSSIYVQYPSGRAHTMLYDNLQLSEQEEDFVAFRVNLPQTLVTDLSLNISVNYRMDGTWRTATHPITIPVTRNINSFIFNVPTTIATISPNSVGSFALTFLGQKRLLHAQITFTNTELLTFAYPSNRNFTSFYNDSQLDVNEYDFATVFVYSGACFQSLCANVIPVSFAISWWNGVQYISQDFSTSISIINPNKKRIASDFEIRSTMNLEVVSGVGSWILFDVDSLGGELTNFQVTASTFSPSLAIEHLNGPFSLAMPSGTISAGGSTYVAIFVTPTAFGDQNITLDISYTKSGTQFTASKEFTLHVMKNEFRLTILSLNVEVGKEMKVIVPYEADYVISNVEANVISGTSDNIMVEPIYGAGSGGALNSNYAIFKVRATKNGTYPLIVEFTYMNSDTEESKLFKVSFNIIAVGAIEEEKYLGDDAVEEDDGDEVSVPVSAIVGASVALGIVVVVLVAAIIFLVNRRKRNKIFLVE